MKKVFIMNGSPRENWNTAKMCKSFSDGLQTKGIETEIVNLYDIDFKGCRSCFACKLNGGKNFSRCAYPDELTSVLDKISHADGLVVASPIYFGDVTGVVRCFTERLMFPFFQYDGKFSSTAPKKLETALIYTMNVNEDACNQMYTDFMKRIDWFYEKVFGTTPVRIFAFDTYQFSDYSKYASECFDPVHKKKQLEEQLPKDLNTAFNEGVKMAERINNGN